ncbi:MAG: CoA transferase [Pseudomonadota bacterium]
MLEVGDALAAGYCGRLFAQVGGEVVRIERKESAAKTDYQRAIDRFLHPAKERSVVDWTTDAGRARFHELAQSVDIVISDLAPRELDTLDWGRTSGPVWTSVTPFGLSGPYRDWHADASVLLAMGGYTYLMGDKGRPPLTLPGHYPQFQAGQIAFVTALATHLASARHVDTARVVDISMLETVLGLSQFTTVLWTYQGRIRSRHGNHFENVHPLALYRCKDGWVAFNIVNHFWKPFTELLNAPELYDDPRFVTNLDRVAHRDALDVIIEERLQTMTRAEVLEAGQRQYRVPTGIMLNYDEVLADPHLHARGFWSRPDAPASPDVDPSSLVELARPAWSRVASAVGDSTSPAETSPPVATRAPQTAVQPLAGVRIVDFTHVWAGPLATRILADLGADVIKVEPPWSRGPDVPPPGTSWIYPQHEPGDAHWNRQGVFNKLNRNKRSLSIDLKQPGARERVLALMAQSDVVIDNFSARAMQSLGFDWETISAMNPALIRVAMPGFGISGPYNEFVAYGPSVEPMTGLTARMGYSADEPRMTSMALPDAIAGVTAAVAVVQALAHRDAEGRGAFYETSLHESAIALFAEQLIYHQMGGDSAPRANGHPDYAPVGIYPICGDDQWIALSIRTDDEWQRFLACVTDNSNDSQPLSDQTWLTNASRHRHRDTLDRALVRWSQTQSRSIVERLQRSGIACGPVARANDLFDDPHLSARGFFAILGSSDVPDIAYPGSPVMAGDATTHDHRGWTGAPKLGEHNGSVLRDLVGESADTVRALEAASVIAKRPPPG